MSKRRKSASKNLMISRESDICRKKLPSRRQVLGNFLYEIEENKKTKKESARSVISRVLRFWEQARCPTMAKIKCEMKLLKLFDTFARLRKNVHRNSKTQTDNEIKFSYELEDLFDIAHKNALNLIQNPEDKKFLILQRKKGRIGYMAGVDKKLSRAEKQLCKREVSALKYQEKVTQEEKAMGERATLASSTDEDSNGSKPKRTHFGLRQKRESDIDSDFASGPSNKRIKSSINDQSSSAPSTTTRPCTRGTKQILDSDLAATLDRTNTSNRKATFILAQTAKSLGVQDVSAMCINEKSIRNRRAKLPKESAENIQNNFSPDVPLLLYWDGKLLPDILGGEKKVDRLPVLVSGFNIDELLRVPALVCGTGHAQADAVYETVQEWKIHQIVAGLCFNTTATNTGHKQGTCMYLEKYLGKSLLYFACRHHIPELVLESVITCCLGPRKQPDWPLFKTFQDGWSKIDQSKYTTVLNDRKLFQRMKSDKKEIINFCLDQLGQKNQPRDDYKELLELVIIFLGEKPPGGVKFRKPGAMSNARWMAKAIYSLKMWIFHKQTVLTNEICRQLAEICIFVATVYVKYWYQAPSAMLAPLNDLEFLKKLESYAKINPEVSVVAKEKFLRHLWYLSEELICLALFDERVSRQTKSRMIKALKDKYSNEKPAKKRNLDALTSKKIMQLKLEDYVTTNSMYFFEALKISTDFLSKNPSEWKSSDSFKNALQTVKSLRPINDNAERGVALITTFNQSITKKEDQKQYLLRVVHAHRKKFPTAAKKNLL